MRLSPLIVVALLCALSCAGHTHPNHIQPRFRGGRLYRTAKETHDRMMLDNNIYYNTTPNAFAQSLDHKNPDAGTFFQRFWVDYSAWSGNGPAMLYINGEAPAESSPTGFCAQYGHSKGAVLFTLENRYYGGSMPSPLTNYSMLSRYLSVDHALEDLRSFMRFVEGPGLLNKTLRWFIVGGSYSGAVSAWFKQRYPSAVLAAWSSSGVVEAQFNFYDYDGHVGEEIYPECRQSIQNVLQLFDEMWDDPSERQTLLNAFQIPPYFLKQDVSYMLADAAAGAVQYGMKFDLCNAIVPQDKADPLGQYNNMIVDLWGPGFASGCYYSTECLSNKSMSQYWADAGYAWIFQTCSQMAYFQVGYYNSVRLSDVSTDYFVAQCRSAFAPDIFPDVHAFNQKYGGLAPDATNVIALQGSDDPWSTTGVRKALGTNYPAVVAECEGCGHCGDLMPPLASDPPSLQAQRDQIVHYMDIWLSSVPTSYQLVLRGNLSQFVGDSAAAATLSDAVLLDIRAAVDQSVVVEVCEITSNSMTVTFVLQLNELNTPIVNANVQLCVNTSAWLSHTSASFAALGGVGALSVVSLGSTSGGSTPASSTCGTGCVVGATVGGAACLLVSVVLVLRFRRRAVSLVDAPEPITGTRSEQSVLLH